MRIQLATLALAAAVALAATGCGSSDEGCPEETAIADESFSPPATCSVPSRTLAINITLCEACSRTAPSCTPDILSTPTASLPGQIFLSTQLDVCEEDSSCTAQACGTATCVVTVPAPGPYDVVYIAGTDEDGGFITPSFEVVFESAGPSCI